MRPSRLYSRLQRLYAIFGRPKWSWTIPARCDVVIYDATNADLLLPYLGPYRTEILSIRGESIHARCLLRALLTPTFWKGLPVQAYVDAFISGSSPKVVITFIDNNSDFYSISSRFPHVTTVFLQNGTRGEVGDIFGYLKPLAQYHVDWMLVHNAAVGRHYRKFVSGNALPVGSLKNNSTPVASNGAKEGVLFISQYHPRPDGNAPLWVEPDGTPIYWDQFFVADRMVIAFLGRWCRTNRRALRVCGRESKRSDIEREFFTNELADCDWEFVPRSSGSSAYMLIDSAEMVVTVDSTLGYEAIGRCKKTAVLSCRVINQPKTSLEFGWPAAFPGNGPFWTNELNEREFERVMNYLLGVGDAKWEDTRLQYADDLMAYDPGNSLLVALLERIVREP
jgi:surface carbohydrate biosynthesis protein